MKAAFAIPTILFCATAPRAFSQQYVFSTLAGAGLPATPVAALRASIGGMISVMSNPSGALFVSGDACYCVLSIDAGGTLTVFAGNGVGGFSGDGALATKASISVIYGIAQDKLGNVYLSDFYEHTIRKVSTAGIITTVAGTGKAGYSGDGGQATAALLNEPAGLAVDGAGNLYIADLGNFAVRKVSPNGVITTVAGNGKRGNAGDGGPATASSFSRVFAVAVGPTEEFYFSDYDNRRVRKVSAAGTISTVATNYALGLAVNSSGNLYISDGTAARIFSVTPAGVTTTIAGTGTSGYSGDGGSATKAQLSGVRGISFDGARNLYIADGNRIRKISSGGNITTVAGDGTVHFSGDGGPATSALLQSPRGLAADRDGNIYIADHENQRIRKVSATGMLSTFAGDGTAGPATKGELNFPRGLALDGGGNLYVAEYGDVRKISPSGTVMVVAGTGQLGYDTSGDGGLAVNAPLIANDIVLDSDGNLYIAAYVAIRKVSPSGIITTIAGNGTSLGYSGDGGPALSAGITAAYLTIDSDNTIYFSDTTHNVIRKVTADGTITTVTGTGIAGFSGDGGPAAAAQLAGPRGLAFDRQGNLLVVDSRNRRVRQIDSNGMIQTIAGNGYGYIQDGLAATAEGLIYPEVIAVDYAGNIYLSDAYGNDAYYNAVRILKPVQQLARSTTLSLPAGLALDSSGNLYVAESAAVRRITPSNQITLVAGTGSQGYTGDGGPGPKAALHFPAGMAFDGQGNLYIADEGNHVVRKLSSAGIITTLAGTGTAGYSGDGGPAQNAQLNNPVGVAINSSENIYVVEQTGARVRQIAPDGTITTVAGTGVSGYTGDGGPATSARLQVPHSLAFDSTGNLLIGEFGAIRLLHADGTISTLAGNGKLGYSGDGGAATDAAINWIWAVAVGPDGSIYCADSRNSRVRKITPDGQIGNFAGNGIAAYSGDGGFASDASLKAPSSLVVDSAGNVYIGDRDGNSVRKVTPDGVITTIAGQTP